MLECRSQASCTARRLVGQMRNGHQRTGGQQQQHEHQRRTFSYNFSPQLHRDTRLLDEQQQQQQHSEQYCHNHHHDTSQQLNNNNGHLMDEQQVDEFLSEEESFGSSSMVSITTTTSPDDHFNQQQEQELSSREQQVNVRNKTKHKSPIIVNNAKTQHFVRCSALSGSASQRRSSSSRRYARRSGRQRAHRQVRFQPTPQSINISSNSSSLPDDYEHESTHEKASAHQQASGPTFNKQQAAAVKRLRRAVHLPSAKPIARRLHHLSHLKLSEKIKLKSFNQLAQHFQQSLSSNNYSSTPVNSASANSTTVQQVRLIQQVSASPPQAQLTGTGANEDHDHDDDDAGWGSDFDEHSSQDSSLDQQHQLTGSCWSSEHSTVATGNSSGSTHDYLLEIGKVSCDERAIEDVIQDRGISGQFKRLNLDSVPAAVDVQQVAPTCGASNNNNNHLLSATTTTTTTTTAAAAAVAVGGHKLRIELERRMILDTLRADAGHAHSTEPPESPAELHTPSEDDDEAELRSLEARQGFRQIRDKLKLILDQRLASYEQEAAITISGHSNNQAAVKSPANSVPQPPERTTSVLVVASQSASPSTAATIAAVSCSTTDNNSNKQHQTTSDDCQSHCSDESGLESNHSGSQDSGHSTQHSGYSASHRCHRHSGHAPSLETDTLGSSAAQSPAGGACELREASSSSSDHKMPSATASASSSSDEGVADLERRSRFLQNRLIINSKLESMFKSRQQVSASSGNQVQLARSNTVASLAAPKALKTSTTGNASLLDVSHLATLSPCSSTSGTDSSAAFEMRNRLLEQQRQMSLKLKQKPRRKSAKRAVETMEIQQEQQQQQPPQPPPLPPPAPVTGSSHYNGSYDCSEYSDDTRRATLSSDRRDSLAKQLSMICLRQAASNQQQQVAVKVAHQTNSSNNNHQLQQQQPRAAQSLRQLVKDVIDDCEKPNKLSPLTLSILNRSSDSLSSELAANATSATPGDQQQQRTSTGATGCAFSSVSSSLSSLPAHQSTCNSNSNNYLQSQQQFHILQQQQQDDHLSSGSSKATPQNVENALREEFRQPIGYIYPVPLANPLHFQQQQQQQQQQQVVDQSLSSLGSIEGLEFSLGNSSSGDDLSVAANQQQQQQQQQLSNKQAVGNKSSSFSALAAQRMQKSSIGSYLKSLREFSRFKLPKVKLISGSTSAVDVQRQDTTTLSANNNHHNDPLFYNHQLPFETQQQQQLLDAGGNSAANGSCNNYNYEYHLDRVVGRQQQQHHHHHLHQQPQKPPEASSTLAGGWRQRPKRMSIMEADSRAAIAMMSSSPTTATTITSSPGTAAAAASSSTSSTPAKGDGFANHFVTISNRKWKSCHLRTSLMQITAFKSHYQTGDATHNHHHHGNQHNLFQMAVGNNNHSPVHRVKRQLAYLDNSRNFTDDDN